MSKHNKIGTKGEQIAASFLQKKGYSILHANWRFGHKEVDIIALKDGMLVIAEVKTRTGKMLGFPEDAVTKSKQHLLKAAAEAFSAENPQYRNIRFDIVSIVMDGDVAKEIVHFEEAFY